MPVSFNPERVIFFESADAFGAWLEANHATETEVWLGALEEAHRQAGHDLVGVGRRGAALRLDRLRPAPHRRRPAARSASRRASRPASGPTSTSRRSPRSPPPDACTPRGSRRSSATRRPQRHLLLRAARAGAVTPSRSRSSRSTARRGRGSSPSRPATAVARSTGSCRRRSRRPAHDGSPPSSTTRANELPPQAVHLAEADHDPRGAGGPVVDDRALNRALLARQLLLERSDARRRPVPSSTSSGCRRRRRSRRTSASGRRARRVQHRATSPTLCSTDAWSASPPCARPSTCTPGATRSRSGRSSTPSVSACCSPRAARA